jgi:hypothetical protein
MERKSKKVNVVEEPAKLHWKKLGGGVLRLKGQIIKPNQEFWAYAEDIPVSFLDCIVCLDDSKLQEAKVAEKKIAETPEELFTLKRTKGGLYNVLNANGKAINEEPFEKEDAQELKTALES